MNSEVLNSWKEIAAYLGRGVRTVQRWERELELPVRRPRGRERSAVIALKPDLDLWLHKVPRGSLLDRKTAPRAHEDLQRNTEQLIERTRELLKYSTKTREIVKDTMALTIMIKRRQAERVRERAERSKGRELVVSQTSRVNANILQIQSRVEGAALKAIPAVKAGAPR